MAPSLLSDPEVRHRLPRLTAHLGDQLAARERELERLGPVPLWQVEQDLELLERYAPPTEIARAYRRQLRNQGQFVDAMYEIRVAAMLAPFVEKLELAPRVGTGECDARCVIGGRDVFVEVTATSDPWTREEVRSEPPPDILEPRGRVADPRGDPGSIPDAVELRRTSRSKELAGRVRDKLGRFRALPPEALGVLVVGDTAGHPLNMEDALWGHEVLRGNGRSCWRERVPSGLLASGDDAGSVSRISAIVWMRLAPRWNNLRVHSWMAENEHTGTPLSREAARVLWEIFDRGAVLRAELERIVTRVRERYDPERVVVFGSLARDLRLDVRHSVHQWSDLDLVVVKATPLRFVDRVRELIDLLQPRVGLNLLVYTPEEVEGMERAGTAFWLDEVRKKGKVLYPAHA